MKPVTSLQNPLVKDAAALQQKKYRDETGFFLVEGEGPCVDAIERGWSCEALFVRAEAPPIPDPLPQGEREKIMKKVPLPLWERLGEGAATYAVTHEILSKISKKSNPQPVMGVFHQRLQDTPGKTDFYLALEEIRDPGNLGTIMRTAHAVGQTEIILIGECCDAFAPEAIRASMGSFSFIRLSAMSQENFLQWQTEQKLALIGTDVVDAVDYRKADYSNALLVMGNEQKGLSPALKARCTSRVHIPMPGGTESLNLSVATGLVLYEACV